MTVVWCWKFPHMTIILKNKIQNDSNMFSKNG